MAQSVNITINRVVDKICKEKKIPFEIDEYPEPNSITYAAMENAENGTDIYGLFDNMSDLIENLNA